MTGSNSVPTPIVDKNGKQTTVHRGRADSTRTVSADRVRGIDGKMEKPTTKEDRLDPTSEELRDVIYDAFVEHNRDFIEGKHTYTPNTVPLYRILDKIIGHDPSHGKPEAAYGGKSKQGWYNEYISVSGVKKRLDQMTEDGTLVYVTDPSDQERRMGTGDPNAKYAHGSYRYKAGYILSEDLEESKRIVDSKTNAQKITKLRAKAVELVAARHQDEVEAELDRLREEIGI